MSFVVVVVVPPPGGEQHHLGAAGDEPLTAVQDLADVPGVAGHHRTADLGPAVQILVAYLCGAHTVLALQFGHDGPHDRPLLLERVHVAEEQVEGECSYEHVGQT